VADATGCTGVTYPFTAYFSSLRGSSRRAKDVVRHARLFTGELPPELNEVVMNAIAREPEKRFSNVRALALALEPFAAGARFDATGSALTIPPRFRFSIKQKRSKKLWLAAPLIAGLVMVFAIGVASEKRGRPKQRNFVEMVVPELGRQ
jgi:hypothetical protein